MTRSIRPGLVLVVALFPSLFASWMAPMGPEEDFDVVEATIRAVFLDILDFSARVLITHGASRSWAASLTCGAVLPLALAV